MSALSHKKPDPILLMIAGAKGAVASTVAVAGIALDEYPDLIRPYLTTNGKLSFSGPTRSVKVAGWDTRPSALVECVAAHGVLPESLWKRHSDRLGQIDLRPSPDGQLDFKSRVDAIRQDMADFKRSLPKARPVFVNLLPASHQHGLGACPDVDSLYRERVPRSFPDLAFALAAILSDIPVVNFSPNAVEIPALIRVATENNVPMAGRDGKTGQTYFKVVLASALKARHLGVDGWYSLNILGNADGKNLMDPERAAGKVANKTELLNDILGYAVGEDYGHNTHKVHIDYYPPRGDAKEAWDVIDFKGIFGLPMSIRVNFQARDSILAAPMILDLAHWMVCLKQAGRSGPVPALGFYFKKPVGDHPPLTFQDQIRALEKLAEACGK
ncbi:MAG: hypothetical protein DSY89_11065 [Deltaproteobacteria bacterium]|nr:MAG: hypothetical protein DSY89_11065 [Deltaproteobacteria bacterium]